MTPRVSFIALCLACALQGAAHARAVQARAPQASQAPRTAETPALNPELRASLWPAWWIAHPGADNDYGVYHFRKTIELDAAPDRFIIHVSADNRYKLFVNGEMVSLGPARSDIYNWAFETVDISPYLRRGENTLAAVVWYFAGYSPVAQMSFGQTGLIVQGDGPAEQCVNTDASWKSVRNGGYSPIVTNLQSYFVVGPGDGVDAAEYRWGWEQADYDDSAWEPSRRIIRGGVKGSRDYPGRQLVQRAIPQMEMTRERIAAVRRVEGVSMPAGFLSERGDYTIPASSSVTLLLDQSQLTTAYLTLDFSRGRDTRITIKYAESLYEKIPNVKGNRDEIDGKVFFGYDDRIVADGGEGRSFTSLWWRTWRYIQLEIETAAEPLVLHDIYGTYTGYPFELASGFSAPQAPELDRVLSVGWRTARLCAHETYMDCPYYEQLQYFGDSRIQAMISMYNTRDDRLVRNNLDNARQSIAMDGLTMSRYPSGLHQFIPSYSIWWIASLHDYWMMRDDAEYVAAQLPHTRLVLDFYERRLGADGSLSRMPYWFFTDWADGFQGGVAPVLPDGQSSVQDLHLLAGLEAAAEMESALGMEAFAERYRALSSKIRSGFRAKYWDEGRGLFADTSRKEEFSQHANILAILTRMVEGADAARLMDRLLEEPGLTRASVYFRYYLNMALSASGMGDRYLDMLDIWYTHLANGLTTWAESPEPARSDCHAWGSSPNVEIFRTVLGIRSGSPGFRSVVIAPAPGELKELSGSMPHPRGDISVKYAVGADGGIRAEITLPPATDGTFVWRGRSVPLRGGAQTVTL
jgi:hypothetical protein